MSNGGSKSPGGSSPGEDGVVSITAATAGTAHTRSENRKVGNRTEGNQPPAVQLIVYPRDAIIVRAATATAGPAVRSRGSTGRATSQARGEDRASLHSRKRSCCPAPGRSKRRRSATMDCSEKGRRGEGLYMWESTKTWTRTLRLEAETRSAHSPLSAGRASPLGLASGRGNRRPSERTFYGE